MSEPVDQIRTVRLAFELRIEASAQRTFEVMTRPRDPEARDQPTLLPAVRQ